jgi:anti-sigma factor (TIGR02949 family)
MSFYDKYRAKTLLYLDNDLQGEELDAFRNHLETCGGCRASLEAELALSRLLRGSRPLYSAPDRLRSRVSALLRGDSEHKVPKYPV